MKNTHYDYYIWSLFLQPSQRKRSEALCLFLNEIEQIPHKTSEEMIGMIRYQWWREAITEGLIKKHDVIEKMKDTFTEKDYSLLLEIIDTHERFLDEKPFKDQTDFEGFCSKKYGNILKIISSKNDQLTLLHGYINLYRMCSYYPNIAILEKEDLSNKIQELKQEASKLELNKELKKFRKILNHYAVKVKNSSTSEFTPIQNINWWGLLKLTF